MRSKTDWRPAYIKRNWFSWNVVTLNSLNCSAQCQNTYTLSSRSSAIWRISNKITIFPECSRILASLSGSRFLYQPLLWLKLLAGFPPTQDVRHNTIIEANYRQKGELVKWLTNGRLVIPSTTGLSLGASTIVPFPPASSFSLSLRESLSMYHNDNDYRNDTDVFLNIIILNSSAYSSL